MPKSYSGPSIAGLTVDVSGPFFDRDPAKTYFENIESMLDDLAAWGEGEVKSRTPVRTGFTQSGVVGRRRSLGGTPWHLTMVISQTHVFPWAHKGERGFTGRGEAEYRGGRLEARRHMFAQVRRSLMQARRVLMANLTKGME